MTHHGTPTMTLDEYRRLVGGGVAVHSPEEAQRVADRREKARETRRQQLQRMVWALLEDGRHVALELRFHPERRWRWDVALTDVLIAVEIDGGGWVQGRHHRAEGRRNDEEKRQAGESLGWRVIRVDWDHVKSGEALQLVRRIAEERRAG